MTVIRGTTMLFGLFSGKVEGTRKAGGFDWKRNQMGIRVVVSFMRKPAQWYRVS